jgi:hydroxymethylbilane synthase
MSRTIVGSRGQALPVAQTRSVVADLAAEWPDIAFVQRTLPASSSSEALLEVLARGQIGIAVFDLPTLPLTLPDGLELAAVTKRLEPRSALIAKGQRTLGDLRSGAQVGVESERDGVFVRNARRDLQAVALSERFEDSLALLAAEQLDALVLGAAQLIWLGRRQHATVILDAEVFPPAPGQGATALVVRGDDDLAFELAYTLQHRPSFDRVTAERAFARALADGGRTVGALATVSADGDLSLFGAVADPGNHVSIQAETSGDANEAEALGRELAQDVLEQLKQRA